MADVFSEKKRSAIMAAIRSKHTAPEKALKKWLKGNGIRYRSHVKRLPGTPDVVLPESKIAIFINGCFWHGHNACRRSKLPTTNVEFWKLKIRKNVKRDKIVSQKLRAMGWEVRIYWTCTKLLSFASKLERSSDLLT